MRLPWYAASACYLSSARHAATARYAAVLIVFPPRMLAMLPVSATCMLPMLAMLSMFAVLLSSLF